MAMRPPHPTLSRRAALSAGAASVALAAAPARAELPVLRLQGSTTFNSELLQDHAASIGHAAGVRLVVVPNKSNLGLIALLQGEADLAMISTQLSNETEVIGRTHPGLPFGQLQDHEVARTRAALIVHPGNPVHAMPEDGLRRVLAGEVTTWREFGGPDLPIRLVAVREGGGVVATVEASVLGPGRHIAAHDQVRVQNGSQIVRVVEQEVTALGITQVKLTRGRLVRELDVGRPIEQTLLLVSLGDPSLHARAVIEACRAAVQAPAG